MKFIVEDRLPLAAKNEAAKIVLNALVFEKYSVSIFHTNIFWHLVKRYTTSMKAKRQQVQIQRTS